MCCLLLLDWEAEQRDPLIYDIFQVLLDSIRYTSPENQHLVCWALCYKGPYYKPSLDNLMAFCLQCGQSGCVGRASCRGMFPLHLCSLEPSLQSSADAYLSKLVARQMGGAVVAATLAS